MTERERSPNFYGSRTLSESPLRNQQSSFGMRQPLYLQPNSPFMSPRGSRFSTPRNSFGSPRNSFGSPRNSFGSPRNSFETPDFLPLGVSSPVSRPRHRPSWNKHNSSNYSNYSGHSSPPSSNSSYAYSPYKKQNFRGGKRGRGSFNNSSDGSNSPHISLYVNKDALRDPWEHLEKNLREQTSDRQLQDDSIQETQDSAVALDSGESTDSSDDEEES